LILQNTTPHIDTIYSVMLNYRCKVGRGVIIFLKKKSS